MPVAVTGSACELVAGRCAFCYKTLLRVGLRIAAFLFSLGCEEVKIISAFFSFFFFKVSLPQTTKEPVPEVSKNMGVRAFFPLSTMLAWDPE